MRRRRQPPRLGLDCRARARASVRGQGTGEPPPWRVTPGWIGGVGAAATADSGGRTACAGGCGHAASSGLRRAVDAHGLALRPDASGDRRKKSVRECPGRHMPPEMGVVP